MIKCLWSSLLLLFAVAVQAQVVTVAPTFPTDTEPVTITFNAAEGNGALAGCNCTVYAHTGVITSNSATPTDWQHVQGNWGTADPNVQMTALGNDLYSITYPTGIRDYYNVPAGVTVDRMAFVFRDQAGNTVGRESDGSDIFYDVATAGADLQTTFITPAQSSFVANTGETIAVSASASMAADLELYENGVLLTSVANSTQLDYNLTAGSAGNNEVMFVATTATTADTSYFQYVVIGSVQIGALPANTEDGINYMPDGSVVLRLYAPGKQNVFVLGDMTNWNLDADFLMKRTPDGQRFHLTMNNVAPGEVRFQYLVDGDILIADPYSEVVLDAFNDQFISIYPDMPEYPTGLTTGLVGVMFPGAPDFEWNDGGFQQPEKMDMVVYELLLRDFIGSHDYATLSDSLDYLQRLGVNVIELMPINEFEGNISWGYNPSFHGAVDKYYGSPEMLKTFVDECHSRGIAVVIDVVYNHAFSQSPLCQLYWDQANFKPAANNPWLNPDAKHPFNVGYDFNHESGATQYWMDLTLRRWVEEYHIDGFRFDLSKGFTQNQTNDVGAWSSYDQSRINLLKRMADQLWAVDSDTYIILEHFGANNEEIELSNYGMMLWGNMNHAYNEATMGYSSNLAGGYYANRGWSNPHLVTYMESHDEERLMYKNLQFGAQNGSYNVKNLQTALDRVELASAFFYPIPGPKMLWQFGELGYDFSINYCENGTINEDCRTAPKPIRWDYLSDAGRRDLYDVTADLIYLKTNFEVFKTTDVGLDVGGFMKRIHLTDPNSMNVLVMGNFGTSQGSVAPFFQNTGKWYEFFSGDSITVNDTQAPITLQAGEYRLYTTMRVERPSQQQGAPTAIDPITGAETAFGMLLAPNPTSDFSVVTYTLPAAAEVELAVFDLQGRMIYSDQTAQGAGQHSAAIQQLPAAGVYLVRLTANGVSQTRKLVVR